MDWTPAAWCRSDDRGRAAPPVRGGRDAPADAPRPGRVTAGWAQVVADDRARAFAAALQDLEKTGDVAGFVSGVFAEDAELVRPETGQQERGTAGARQFWQQYVDQFQEIRSEFARVVDGEVAVLECTSTGRLGSGERWSWTPPRRRPCSRPGRSTRTAERPGGRSAPPDGGRPDRATLCCEAARGPGEAYHRNSGLRRTDTGCLSGDVFPVGPAEPDRVRVRSLLSPGRCRPAASPRRR